jgi:hypothetical protein
MMLSNYADLLRKLHRKDEARRVEAQIRELRRAFANGNSQHYQVDWRDLQSNRH